MLLLDTEGSGSLQKNQTHDAKIFALVVLLSSLFIFNSMQTIDESAISCLSLATEISSFLKLQGSKDTFTPKFLWLLRDFALELKENGREITENEYLEGRLSNFSRGANQRNKRVREALLKHFQQRELLAMVRPVEEEEELARLDAVPWAKLREEFRKKVTVLRHKVFNETPPKQIGGRPLTGVMLAELIEAYVEALNKGATPSIGNAWDSVVEQEGQRLIAKASQIVDAGFKELALPVSALEVLVKADVSRVY